MSDKTLEALITKLKSEAIDKAEKESQRIIDKAEQKAEQLLKAAQTKSDELISSAKKKSEVTLVRGEMALKQAARDMSIVVKSDIITLFKLVLESEIETAFTPELYAVIITQVIDTLGDDITFTLPSNIEDEVINAINRALKQSEITTQLLKDKRLLSGLSVTKTDAGWRYDITAEEVSELISQHLSQKWMDILNRK